MRSDPKHYSLTPTARLITPLATARWPITVVAPRTLPLAIMRLPKTASESEIQPLVLVQRLATSAADANTASGFEALLTNTTGNSNTAVGYHALADNDTGNNNIGLGAGAGVNVATASNVICIGDVGADVSNSCFIGNIYGVITQNTGVPVVIDSAGQLGTMSSSRRFKKDIQPMAHASDAILELKPVAFHYRNEGDKHSAIWFDR